MSIAIAKAEITVSLVSGDPELLRLCREALGEISGHSWSLNATNSDSVELDSDIMLWDYERGMSLRVPTRSNLSKHLFLVRREDIAEFQAAIAPLEANILLKPVTRTTLQSCLELAVSAHQDRTSPASESRAERDDILQCLIQTNLRLQEADQDRTTFLARAVHDFRAPLTALSGYCGLLLEEPLGTLTEPQKEVLRRMLHSARRLSRMAAAMFELSVGRQVKVAPNLQPNDLRECLDQALHETMPFADEKRISINVDMAPCGYQLYFEAGQIEQALINILDNACKFTPRNGSIEIRGYSYFWERRVCRLSVSASAERRQEHCNEPNSYRLDIQDSGTPIPVEHLERIFEEYTSFDGCRDRSGGGLGLAITHMIMAQHKGRVWAENTSFGPMFSLVFPFFGKLQNQ
ncbi:MAG TPA: HAMP domain-containing sensor histidine kinase [Verrucomicrobiae bacterium]|nr:HAMP domain-containing sensor histidine kinase [Verrucomicrobiae bacterium]